MTLARRLVQATTVVALLAVALVGVIAATTHPAGACSCALRSNREVAVEADAVVIGTRVDRRTRGPMVIEVEQVLKGRRPLVRRSSRPTSTAGLRSSSISGRCCFSIAPVAVCR